MPDKKDRLTKQEAIFVERFARSGDRRYAAEKAGYAAPDASASQLMNRPTVRREIYKRALDRAGTAMEMGWGRLVQMLEDKKTPDRVVVQITALATKTVAAEMAEEGKDDDIATMGPQEFQRRAAEALARHERLLRMLDGEAEEAEIEEGDTADGGLFE